MSTDKEYWHLYIPEYEKVIFSKMTPFHIFEFGVLSGDSIRWMHKRFPDAMIVGADIDFNIVQWPRHRNISYAQVDQGDRQSIAELFKNLNHKFDLIIDDGSHDPHHQAICLNECWGHVKSGGFYIVEDIHTNVGIPDYTPLNTLLAMQHCKSINRPYPLSIRSSYFSIDELVKLYESIDLYHLYRRTFLPKECWKCHSSDFDYKSLRCSCGEQLYKFNDSMAFILRKA